MHYKFLFALQNQLPIIGVLFPLNLPLNIDLKILLYSDQGIGCL
jgi:hypothetical protein